METNLALGRIAGIRVGLHWSVLVIWWLLTWSLATTLLPSAAAGESALTYWATASLAAVLLLGCLLAHELSHAIMARRHGVATESITLWALGGVAQLQEESPSPRSELLISAAGPAMSLALAAGAFGLSGMLLGLGAADIAVATLSWLALVNLALAVFNLVPGIPLDGGRILHAILWWRSGDRLRATRAATQTGRVVGYGLIGLGVLEITSGYWGGLWLVLVGWFLLSAATNERNVGGLQHLLGDLTAADVMTPHPDTVPGWITVDRLLAEFVLRFRHSSFPVLDRQGRVAGLVTLAEVKRLEPQHHPTTLVADIATPIEQVPTVDPSTPVVDLIQDLAAAGNGTGRRALVVAADRLAAEGVVGIITPTDIARAVEIGSLTKV